MNFILSKPFIYLSLIVHLLFSYIKEERVITPRAIKLDVSFLC